MRKMSEIEDILLRAKNEINALRNRNSILEAKVEMIDLFATVLHSKPAQRLESSGIDVAWEIDKFLRELHASKA